MSRLRKFGLEQLAFGIYVPAAIVKDGQLVVSWATGQPATSQIDWGLDSSVANTTNVKLLQPGEEGFVQGENNPKLERYHEIEYPATSVGSDHYFRVRSVNADGQRLQSQVYSVYLNDKLLLSERLSITIPAPKKSTFQPAKELPNPAIGTTISRRQHASNDLFDISFAGARANSLAKTHPGDINSFITTVIETNVQSL